MIIVLCVRWRTYIELSIRPGTPSISCCRPTGIWLPKHFLQLALHRTGRRSRVIKVDGHPADAAAISELKLSGVLGRRCRCLPSPYLNNVLEQDQRFIKKRIADSLWFRSPGGALNTIAGYESMHMIRKGKSAGSRRGDVVRQIRFIHQVYGIAA